MDEYCVKYVRLFTYGIVEEKIEDSLLLEDVEDDAVNSRKNCVYVRVEARNVLVCSDGEEFIVAYRIKC